MDLSLTNIWNSFDKDRIASANQLLPQVGPIQWAYENTVLAEVESEEVFEVLLDLEKDEVIAFSCTCDHPETPCVHTLAVMLLLSKEDDLE